MYAFLQLFLSEFSEYADSPFHISGESYGGHYLPGLSTEIIRNNKVAEEKGYLKINYESVLIGNGWTDSLIQYRHFETYSCAHDSHYKPIYDEETCAGMRKALPHCEKLISACYDYPSALTCLPANLYCEKTQAGPYTQTGLNPYDIRVPCKGDSGLCYDLIDAIKHYANDEDTRAALGVDQKAGHYESCSDSVASQFHQQGDKYGTHKLTNWSFIY